MKEVSWEYRLEPTKPIYENTENGIIIVTEYELIKVLYQSNIRY